MNTRGWFSSAFHIRRPNGVIWTARICDLPARTHWTRWKSLCADLEVTYKPSFYLASIDPLGLFLNLWVLFTLHISIVRSQCDWMSCFLYHVYTFSDSIWVLRYWDNEHQNCSVFFLNKTSAGWRSCSILFKDLMSKGVKACRVD